MAPPFGAATIVSTMASLLVILALLMGAALLARKLRDRGWSLGTRPQTRINLLASRPLGPQTSLLLVEADGHRFLLGTSRAGLTLIGALGAPQNTGQTFEAALAPFTDPPPAWPAP